ncbi:MAG: DUF6602 domain-containing protein [Kofleriaceae bacterium]|nr:DUF6602 domain-containing protein [Kofleriaceae bacterium]
MDQAQPKRFAAGAGFIIDGRDQVSKQTDVVVYDAMNCPVYRASDEAAIIPNDNVAAVVEVKSRLDADRLEEAYANIRAAKRLAKSKAPDVPFLVSTRTLGFLFAFESAITLDKIVEHYRKLLDGNTLADHIDVIAVLDRGLVMLSTKLRNAPTWHPCIFESPGAEHGEGAHLALSASDLGDDTLDAFLRLLLAHLTYFRGIVDHPGFHWAAMQSGGLSRVTYLMSITNETDPERRKARLNEYREEVIKDFAESARSGVSVGSTRK